MKYEEFINLVKKRRSIREYKDEKVQLDLILKALEAARWAPSAHNAQPWRFIIITKNEIKKKLAEEMAKAWRKDLERDGVPKEVIHELINKSIYRFTHAPILILVCLIMEEMFPYSDERRKKIEYILAIQSVSVAIENLLLALSSLGLGACWYCAPLYCQNIIRRLLNIPKEVDPIALITVGYPKEEPKPTTRKPLDEIVYLEEWGVKVKL